ncbi:hypothetical protein C4B63_25g319 [Trypanosoma cruzi]|uniref:Uncharacterized protein n=1 Tax=Trypanosoma cruzi TaxID=5693 RepID=A0A2V2VDU2_TRYCR|nr:hypothetical protein C4B63_25g319 [Trypanosoma cruzi]
MESASKFATNVDRHLDGIEYYLRRMRRRSSARTPHAYGAGSFNMRQERSANRCGESQYKTGQFVRRHPGGSSAARNGPRVLWNRPAKNFNTSASSPPPSRHPPQMKKRGNEGGKGKVVVPSTEKARFSNPLGDLKPAPLSRKTSSLLSASLSTVPSSFSPSSTSSTSPSSRRRQAMALSSVSSNLTSDTLVSFSSLEMSPAGEIATRWLQWRRAAYYLLASHYEKCCAVLTRMRKLGPQKGASRRNKFEMFSEEDNEETKSLTSPSESSDSIDDLSDGEQTSDTIQNAPMSNLIAKSQHDVCIALERTARQLAALSEEEAAGRRGIEDEALRAAEDLERARNHSMRDATVRERQRRLAAQAELEAAKRVHIQRKCRIIEGDEAARRDAIERVEKEELMDLLEAMEQDAWAASEKEAERTARASESLKAHLLSKSELVVAVVSQRKEKAIQTTQKLVTVKISQTEGEVCIEREGMVQNQPTTPKDKSDPAVGRWRQLDFLGQSTHTDGLRAADSSESVPVETSREGRNGVRGDVVGDYISPCCSKYTQTSPPIYVSVQTSADIPYVTLRGPESEPHVPAEAAAPNLEVQLASESSRDLSPRKAEPGPSRSSKCAKATASLETLPGSGVDMEEEEHATGSVEERPVLEVDSPGSHATKPQCSPRVSHASWRETVVRDEMKSLSETGLPQPVDSVREAVRNLRGKSARRRHGGRVLFPPVDAHLSRQDSWTNDDDRQVFSPRWDLKTFDFEWSDEFNLCSSAARDLVRVEMRHRRHVERRELLERNEVRWEELNHYRAWAARQRELLISVAEAADEANTCNKEVEKEKEEEVAYEHGHFLAADAVAPVVHAPEWVHEADEIKDEKEDILPRTEAPQPAVAVNRWPSTAWSVNMTGKTPGIPPHLRNRPWAAMLTRKKTCGGEKLTSAVGRVSSPMSRGYRRTRTVFSGDSEALVMRVPTDDTCNVPVKRVPESVSTKRSAIIPGYAQQYERRLVWQQHRQDAFGMPLPEPFYCRTTMSFLESAEWCYQKKYVDRYLYASPSARRHDGSARKCADAICEEVGRVYVTWGLRQR